MKSKIDRIVPGYRPGPRLQYELKDAGNRVLITFDGNAMTKAMSASLGAAVTLVAEPYMDRDFRQVQDIVIGDLREIFKVAKYQWRWFYDEKREVYDVTLN